MYYQFQGHSPITGACGYTTFGTPHPTAKITCIFQMCPTEPKSILRPLMMHNNVPVIKLLSLIHTGTRPFDMGWGQILTC